MNSLIERMMVRHRLSWSLLLGLLFACLANNAWAVDIEETIWGFDGRVIPYQFNPVSVLVSNTTEEPIGVRLQLKRMQRQGSERVGASVQEEVFLSPFSSRWVQFYPYIVNDKEAWAVSWGFLPSQQKDLPTPNIGGLARVTLVDSSQLSNRTVKAKSFSEDLFPPFVSATGTLEVVYLDHVPRWQEARRQSLLEWVQRGGTLVVTPDPSGEYPVFTSQLSVFNSPLPEHAVGQGLVVHSQDLESIVKEMDARLGPQTVPRLTSNQWGLASGVFQTLKSISNPKHNWWVINFMSIIYVALVFPGWYLLSRSSGNYRTTILAFVGVAILFTFAFNMVGRRGYGESTTVNSVAVARKIDGNQYDVQSWTNVFVTGGDKYDLKFEGDGHLFSTVSGNEKVAAVINNGSDGQFIADIPLFSARPFVHRGKIAGPKWDVTIRESPDGQNSVPIEKVELEISPPPNDGTYLYAIQGDRFHSVYKHEDHYRVAKRSQAADTSLVPDNFGDPYNNYRYGNRTQPRDVSPSVVYGKLVNPSIWKSMGAKTNLPKDRLRILIYDDLPSNFSVKHPKLGESQGKVLYSLDVRLSGKLNTVENAEPEADDSGEPEESFDEDTETETYLEESSDDERSDDE